MVGWRQIHDALSLLCRTPFYCGTCEVPPNYSETFSANLTLSKNQAGFHFNGPAAISMGSNQVVVNNGVFNAFIVGPTPNPSPAVVFFYTGNISSSPVSTPGGGSTTAVRLENISINLTGAGSGAVGFDLFGVKALLRYTGVICINGSNSQIGYRLGSSALIDSEGTRLEAPGVGQCNIGLQSNGTTIFYVYDPFFVGTGLAGTIRLDMEGGATGVSAAHLYGGSISNYKTSLNGVRLVHSTFSSLETESGLLSGTDVVLDSNSANNTVILSGSVTKSASDSGISPQTISTGRAASASVSPGKARTWEPPSAFPDLESAGYRHRALCRESPFLDNAQEAVFK